MPKKKDEPTEPTKTTKTEDTFLTEGEVVGVKNVGSVKGVETYEVVFICDKKLVLGSKYKLGN